MAFPLINPSHQFFDTSGSPLVSGTLEFRDPTTNDLINSYPTADDADAQTNANANPLTLDSRGGYTGLYLEDGVSYKLILKDSAGATVDTQDDVLSPIALPYLTTAAETTAGVTPTNFEYEPGNILRYGTNTTPGTTDMGTAIQAAVDAAEAGDRRVYFPPATYATSTVINIRDNILVDGANATIFQLAGSDLTTVVDLRVGGTDNIKLHLNVDGNSANNTTVEGFLIRGPQTSVTDIRLGVFNCDTGVLINGNTENNVMFVHGTGCGTIVHEQYTVAIGSSPDENTIFISGNSNITNYKKSCETGDKITSMINLSCEATTGDAVNITTVDSVSHTILTGEMRGCTSHGVVIDDPSGNVVLNEFYIDGSDTASTWGIRADDVGKISGSCKVANFSGGVWIKDCDVGNLRVTTNSLTTGNAGVQLGDDGGATAVQRFTLAPGSDITAAGTNGVFLDRAYHCTIHLGFVSGGTNDVLISGASANNTVYANGRSKTAATFVDSSASIRDNKIILEGESLGGLTDSDATPTVTGYDAFTTGATTLTITRFDHGYPGQEIKIISKGAITFDTSTNTRLRGSSADIVTASGDITTWLCEVAGASTESVWYLTGFVDSSTDNSAGA